MKEHHDKNSATPRTDALEKVWAKGRGHDVSIWTHARQLERELAVAVKQCWDTEKLLDTARSSTRESADLEVTLTTTTGMFLKLDRYNVLLEAENFMRAMLDPVPSNARPYVCAGCGDWRLVKRCTKCDDKFYEPPIIEDGRSRPHWRCHKNDGHSGECSTHMDCGARHPDGGTCGFPPDHEGPHGWETSVSASRRSCCQKCGIGPMRETCAYPEACEHPCLEIALERNQALLMAASLKGRQMKITDEMVSRFLSWSLPKDFMPDGGIKFTPVNHPNAWPIGTNLLTAVQARAMLEHVLGTSDDTAERKS